MIHSTSVLLIVYMFGIKSVHHTMALNRNIINTI